MTRRRAFDICFVIAVTCAGAWLRLRQLGVASLWLDEIIHYDAATGAAKQPLWQWLAITQVENGPLFYAIQLAGRLLLPMEASARIAPALFGIAAIPLIWLAARKLDAPPGAAYAAALLLAISPLHVYYSREGRPYAMVVVIAIALMIAMLRGSSMFAVAGLLVVGFYSSALLVPFLISAAAAAVLIRKWRVAIAFVACVILFALCYHPYIQIGTNRIPDVSTLIDSFSVTGIEVMRLHRTGIVFAILAIAGAVALIRRNAAQAAVVITLLILPTLIPIAAAWRMHHFFVVRYALPALPSYLLLVSIGVASVMSLLRKVDAQVAASIAAASLMAAQGWHSAMNEPFRKLDWRIIARTIVKYAQPGDDIIAAHHWSAYCLGFYMRGIAPQMQIVDANGVPPGNPMRPLKPSAWIVVAQDPNGTFTPWACRLPTLLASPIETFHLHYFGARRDLPLRLDEAGGAYLDEVTVWRAQDGRPLPANIDRARLAQILERLGLEPKRAVAELISHRVTLANLATTVAYDSVCDDDATFLRALFRTLLGRDINEQEMRDLGSQLQRGVSRERIAWRMGNSLLR